MRIVWLEWYICFMCLLLALLASATTYHPDVQHLGVVLPAAFGGAALLAGGAAVGLGRLPQTHRPLVWAALGRPRRSRCNRDGVAGPGRLRLSRRTRCCAGQLRVPLATRAPELQRPRTSSGNSARSGPPGNQDML